MSAPTAVERLEVVGRALHGADWQRALARDLGPYHPRGPLASVSDRLLRRWIAGERSVSGWVDDALPRLLAAHRAALVARLDAAAEFLRATAS